MGGRGGSSGRSGGGLKGIANDFMNRNLGIGEEWADVQSAKIVSDVDEKGMADVDVKYSVSRNVQTGVDPETHQVIFEKEDEYLEGTFRMKVK